MTTPQVVIAVRGGIDPKSRLGAALPSSARQDLAVAMLCDMLDQVAACGARAWVVTPDAALAAASAWDAQWLLEEGGGLNGAFALGLSRARVHAPGAVVAWLPGDLALLRSADLSKLLAMDSDLAGVRSVDGGTGGLALQPAVAFEPLFGADSFARHRQAARDQGLSFSELAAPSLAFDLDHPADIEGVLREAPDSRAAAVLRTARR